MKRILAWLLAVMMVLSVLPGTAFAAETETESTEAAESTETVPETEAATEPETLPQEETTAPTEEMTEPPTEPEETLETEETLPPETEETVPPETLPEETIPEETEPEETMPQGLRFELPEAEGEVCDFENRIQPPYYFYQLKLADQERVEIYEGEADISIVAGDSVTLEDATVIPEKAGTTVLALTGEGIPACNTAYVIVEVVDENRAVLAIETSLVVDFEEPELGRDETMDFCYSIEEGSTMELGFTVSALGAAHLSVSVNGGEWETREGSSAEFTAELENRQNIIGIRAFDDQGRVATFYKTVDARLRDPLPEETEPTEATEETEPAEETEPTEELEEETEPEETEETAPIPELYAALTVPTEVVGKAGETFTATVQVEGLETVPGWRLMECTVQIPRELEVADVRMGSMLSGSIYWEVSETDGLLRISYASMEEEVTGETGEIFTMDLRLKEGAEACDELAVRILDMSFGGMPSVSLLFVNEEEEALTASFTVNVENAGAVIHLLSERIISYRAARLYRGDGENLIPSGKQAVCISAAGSSAGQLMFRYGSEEVMFFYNASISGQSQVPSYVAVVDADISMDALENAENFTLLDEEYDALTFGDANGDGAVDAQDALAALDIWLRTGGNSLTDASILCLNINADSGVDTFDVLGILEYYVNGREFPVVTRGAAETE